MYRMIKRGLDIICALAGGIALSPLLVTLALAIKLESSGPVLFQQRRIGKGKNPFYILKFRTMRTNAPKDTPTHLLESPEQYITRVGRFLRRTSLDELPQLWNILVGQMSFVGPRPVLWNQFDLIAARDTSGANDVRPGLTGWAQVNGRDALSIAQKAALDGEYIRRMSFSFDCRCLFATVGSVRTGKGVVEGAKPPQEKQL